MLSRPYRLIAAFVVLTLVQTGYGQSRGASISTKKPGVWHEGRFLGFVPAHRRGEPSETRVETTTNRAIPKAYESSRPVVPVALHSISIDEPAAVSSSLDPIEADWETDAEFMDPACCLSCSFWGRVEYLYWWTRGMDTPPLATTSLPGTPLVQAGVLGQPNTTIVFGDDKMNTRGRSGGRFTLGYWFDPTKCNGIEISYLGLSTETDTYRGSVFDSSILARPFFNVATGTEDARLIVFPAVVDGSLNIEASSAFQSLEALFRHTGYRTPCSKIDYLIGYRYSELEDRLGIRESTVSLAGPTTGTTFDLSDRFDTRNTFNGVELGIVLECEARECWTWESVFKIAVGGTRHRAAIAGQTTTTAPAGASVVTPAGLLALPSNIGSYTQDEFAAIAEVGVSLRRDLRCGLSATMGYSFVYWSNVARAGDQVDRAINPTQIPPGPLVGAARPAFSFISTDFWAQGLRFGLEYAY